MKKDAVQTNVSLPPSNAPRIKPPNYMVFVCGLDRADKAARKAKDPAQLERFQAMRAGAIAAYKAKDYGRAIELHDAAHRAVKREDLPAAPKADGAAVTASAGSPRPPKAKCKPAKATAKKTSPAAAAAKPAKGTTKLSAMSAAHQVLAASKEPLGVQAIVAAMSAKGLWTSPGGKTPHSTLAAAIQRDIAAKGRESRFKKVDRGLFIASAR